MPLISPQATRRLKHSGAFALQVIRAFRANQGLLLAGAVAYYTLLSIVPLLILMVIELAAFTEHREVLGWVLLVSLLFFSSLAFRVLESAISVIFLHRVATHQRNFLVSALLPLAYITFIAMGLFSGTLVLAQLIAIGETELRILGHTWSLGGITRFMLYLAGIAIEILIIFAIYFFLSAGRISPSHALIGGTTTGLLWEIIRHGLAWYFATLSQVNVVYGSLTTTIVVLLSLEITAALLLLGAQVIAEYERFGTGTADQPPVVLRTEKVKDHSAKAA